MTQPEIELEDVNMELYNIESELSEAVNEVEFLTDKIVVLRAKRDKLEHELIGD